MLTIKNLHKSFHGKNILSGTSLSVDSGEIALLLGGSGVGKSTLLRVLSQLEKPDLGVITCDGEKIDDNLVGMVFQHFNLFDHLTVRGNISLALEKVLKKSKNSAHEEAQHLLEKYGLGVRVTGMFLPCPEARNRGLR